MKNYHKIYLLIILLLGFRQFSLAQNHMIDSLRNALKVSQADTNRVNIQNTLGKQYIYISEFPRADSFANEAIKLSEKLNFKKGIAKGYSAIGIVYYYQGDLAKALEYYFKSLKIAEEIGDKTLMLSNIGNVGIVYSNQGDYPKALEYYFKALKMAEESKDKNKIANDLGYIGVVYKNQKDYKKAVEFYNKALDMAREVNNRHLIITNVGNLGNIYTNEKEYDKAIDYYKQALEMAKEDGDKSSVSTNMGNIGSVLIEQKKLKEAEDYLLKAYAIAKETGDIVNVKECEHNLSELYYREGKWKESLDLYKKYIVNRDSIYNEDNTKNTVRAEMNYNFDKKKAEEKAEQEKKDLLTKKELEWQKFVRNVFIGGFALLLILAFFIYRGSRQKQKAYNIIAKQKEEVELQKQIIEEKNHEITSSINYAKRIQTAILVTREEIEKSLKEYLILFKPKDIVSGDFYYYAEKDDKIIIAAVDCTGHGVPGAFMSMIGNDALNEIIINKGITKPGEILTRLHDSVRRALKQDTSKMETTDGMDIALCTLSLPVSETDGVKIEYSGAMRNFYYVSKGSVKLEEIKANKQSIGGVVSAEKKYFTNHTVQLYKGDTFYIFSDGFADQFGGPNGKKFMMKRLKNLIISVQGKNLNEQEQTMEATLEEWKRNEEQIDDILVIGVKI